MTIARREDVSTLEPPVMTGRFYPPVPRTLADTRLPSVVVEDLIFKMLLTKGIMSGRDLAADLCLHFSVVEPILADLKNQMLLAHRSTSGFGDFLYMLTDQGREKGLMAREITAYAGPAPVPFEYYLQSVEEQSIRKEKPGINQLKEAFSDLIIDPQLFDTIGPAVNSARGLFLYGDAGNGKTAIAERISKCFRDNIYIPRSIWIDGQILQVYDPQNHLSVDNENSEFSIAQYDMRWVQIKRPIVMVGGELTMDALEITYNEALKISEGPLQLKANCGVFLIDDFGRQRMNHVELLNRWIVPLEKRIDYLILPNGKKIQVPFDELIIFSTNLDPRELVDEAFLRRIPYKINVMSPNEEEFRKLFSFMAPRYKVPYDEAMVNYLIDKHYRGKREFRACQPRDILEQIINAASYRGIEPQLTPELLDAACRNYFSAMEGDAA